VIGPQGRGLAAAAGVEGFVDLQMGTFSKALGLSGGYVAASREVVDLLINRARSFIYSTAPPPCIAHAARRALEMVGSTEGDRRRETLWRNIALLRSRIGGCADAAAAILPWMVGDETAAVEKSAQLREQGLMIPAIRYPTVARGKARLRITLSAAHEPAQVERLVAALAD
jgi:7-keto-8-aminopelargonate synthetase-like enzyme